MGLDQFAYVHYVKGLTGEPAREEFAYWRKHPNLQGWMEKLYAEKGGTECFNCVPVELTLEDLDRLEADINSSNLPTTAGFFYGGNADNYYKESDLEFIRQAREYIKNGNRVEYSSWW